MILTEKWKRRSQGETSVAVAAAAASPLRLRLETCDGWKEAAVSQAHELLVAYPPLFIVFVVICS